jgi:hypothetical protein
MPVETFEVIIGFTGPIIILGIILICMIVILDKREAKKNSAKYRGSGRRFLQTH